MSFFGYLAAGAAEGIGKGISQEADYGEKLALQKEILADKAAAALQAQRERAQDRADRERENLQLRADLKGDGFGGGKGGGINLFQLAQSADTPEKQQRLMETTRAFAGDDAANVLGRVFGRSDSTTSAVGEDPLSRDAVNGMDKASDTADGVVPQTFVERAKYDADRGRQSLQRLMALVMDPAKLDPYSKGEAQLLRNDVTTNKTLPKVLADPTADTEDFNDALSPLNPRAGLDADKNSLASERIAQAREAEAGRAERAGASLTERGKALLITERKALEKSASNVLADPADVAPLKARIAEIDRQLAAKPAGAGASSKPRAPAAAAAAFNAGRSY